MDLNTNRIHAYDAATLATEIVEQRPEAAAAATAVGSVKVRGADGRQRQVYVGTTTAWSCTVEANRLRGRPMRRPCGPGSFPARRSI